MAKARVVELHAGDPALAEEARVANRLTLGIRKGDAVAESEMIERYSRGLRFLLARRIGDDERARDLLQDTFCIAIEKLRTTDLANPERLAGYLRGIAVRVSLNAQRRRNREPYPIDIDAVAAIPDAEPGQYQQVSKEQTQANIKKLLETMPVERDRDLLTRFYIYDQDKQNICRALGLDSLHFNRVLFRAKKRFRKILEDSPDNNEFFPTENA